MINNKTFKIKILTELAQKIKLKTNPTEAFPMFNKENVLFKALLFDPLRKNIPQLNKSNQEPILKEASQTNERISRRLFSQGSKYARNRYQDAKIYSSQYEMIKSIQLIRKSQKCPLERSYFKHQSVQEIPQVTEQQQSSFVQSDDQVQQQFQNIQQEEGIRMFHNNFIKLKSRLSTYNYRLKQKRDLKLMAQEQYMNQIRPTVSQQTQKYSRDQNIEATISKQKSKNQDHRYQELKNSTWNSFPQRVMTCVVQKKRREPEKIRGIENRNQIHEEIEGWEVGQTHQHPSND